MTVTKGVAKIVVSPVKAVIGIVDDVASGLDDIFDSIF